MRGRPELCTSSLSSLCFLLCLVLTRIIGTSIEVRGWRPLALLLGLQRLRRILLFCLLVGIVVVLFPGLSVSFSFPFADFLLLQGVPLPAAVP